MSEHTGIRLRLVIPGAGTILEVDSDCLHARALFAEYEARGHTAGNFDDVLSGQREAWHLVTEGIVPGTPLEIWVQPVMLADSYPDDEDQEQDGTCDCDCTNCSGCLGAL